MGYLGNEPADVAVTVGQGVIDASHIQDSSITTADLGNDAVTPNKIDDDGTGFQMGSLGVGGAVSGSDKLTVTGASTFSGLTHLKGSAWNSILRLGDTSRSEQLTHMNNGSVNFSIYTSNGTKGVLTANHDGSAMTLGADYGSGTLTIYPPTTFSKNIGIGISPSSTNTSHDSINIGGNGYWASFGTQGAGGEMDIGHNFYYAQSGNNVYISTDEATRYRQSSGKHIFATAPLGSSGTNITFSDVLTLNADASAKFSGHVTLDGVAHPVLKLVGDSSGESTHIQLHRSNGQGFTIYDTTAALAFRADLSSSNPQILQLKSDQSATFFGGVSINNATLGSHKLVVDNGTTSLNRGNSGGDILDVRGLNASQFNVTTTATTVGKRFYVTGNIDGAFGTELYNAHATGHGTKIRGGSTSAHYALFVSNHNQTGSSLFQVLGDGQCQAGSVMKSPNFRTGRNTTSVANTTWTQLSGLTNLSPGLYTIHAYIADYQANQWSVHGVVEHTGNNTMHGIFQNHSTMELRTNNKDVELWHSAGGTFTIQVSWIKQA